MDDGNEDFDDVWMGAFFTGVFVALGLVVLVKALLDIAESIGLLAL